MQILSDENKVLKGLIEEQNRAAGWSLDSSSCDRYAAFSVRFPAFTIPTFSVLLLKNRNV